MSRNTIEDTIELYGHSHIELAKAFEKSQERVAELEGISKTLDLENKLHKEDKRLQLEAVLPIVRTAFDQSKPGEDRRYIEAWLIRYDERG